MNVILLKLLIMYITTYDNYKFGIVMDLLCSIKNVMIKNVKLPFSVYSSVTEQVLLNVPIVKPLLIVILNGEKKLGKDGEFICSAGDFIFLSDSAAINMRNIPENNEYFSLLIEFNLQDFDTIHSKTINKNSFCMGKTTSMLEHCLQQFVDSSLWASEKIWSLRKREIIEVLCQMGHSDILSMIGKSKVSSRVHDIFNKHEFNELSNEFICEQLAMSESTLRRKLKSEGTTVQEIKDQARLGLGLHLLQTTHYPISLIADQCGYQSQSRFTDRFKGRFGLTPSELRKTKMAD